MGRHGYKEVDVVFGDRTLDDFNILYFAYLPYEISQSLGHLSVQNLFPVIRNPDQMVREVIYGVGCCPVVLHIPIVLKSSPKRRDGFLPEGDTNHSS